ncbi:MAG: hypothetical protein GW763_15510 [Paraglaciecola sp.]|nr:hypothetical protein [Paraglaciecola sp.]NCT49359.1 hypothetical protein [Paraglaciecola sp.]
MKTVIRKTLLALTVAGLSMSAGVSQAQAPSNVTEVRNELGIMLNILQASLKQNSRDNIRFRAKSVTYLAQQGVVFDIDSGSSRKFFGFDFGNMFNNLPVAPVAPVAPNAPVVSGSAHFDFDFDSEELEDALREAFGRDEEFAQDSREKMRELSERQRELAWEQREYERNRRDLEFEKRNADGERRKEIEKDLSELSGELQKLQNKRAELEKYSADMAEEQSKLAQKREEAKKQLYSQSLALFEDTVGDMLCRYGAGVKSLPDDENINFVLSDFTTADNDSVIGTHDKVYVFKMKDIRACVTGKINKNKLLGESTTYMF